MDFSWDLDNDDDDDDDDDGDGDDDDDDDGMYCAVVLLDDDHHDKYRVAQCLLSHFFPSLF